NGPDTGSSNIARTLGESLVASNPRLVEKKDANGNTTVWYGFDDISSNNQELWVDATDVSDQQDQSGTNYIGFKPFGTPSEVANFDLTNPQPDNEAVANWNSKTGQYVIDGQPAAVAVEVPAADVNAQL
ncbi:MAG TPA: hypothetical protein VGF75_05465, partial [Candidatus Saccharimonadales bacterium]